MRVFDAADETVFAGLCDALAEKVRDRVGNPDVILGIRNGGVAVAAAFSAYFPGTRLGYVSARRPSTGKKEKMRLKRFLRHLPVRLLDNLRILEARFLAYSGNPDREVNLDISPEIFELMAVPSTKVVVVDDAVDSGYTLQAVIGELSRITTAKLFTAAITATTSAPAVKPDVTLFNDNVLVRFPWSMDAKR